MLALCHARGVLSFVMAPPALGYRAPAHHCHCPSTIRMTAPSAELISAGSQSWDGVEIDMKLENLGGSRRRICAGIKIDVSLNERIPNKSALRSWWQ